MKRMFPSVGSEVAQLKNAIWSLRLRLRSSLRQSGSASRGRFYGRIITPTNKFVGDPDKTRPFRFLPHGAMRIRPKFSNDTIRRALQHAVPLPGLLLGLMDGGSLEQRISRLMDRSAPWTRRWKVMVAAACVVALGGASVGAGMFGVRAASEPQIDAKGMKFEVVSIRPTAPSEGAGPLMWGAPTGYEAKGQTLWTTLMLANFSQAEWLAVRTGREKDPIQGAPAWLKKDLYDITAKVQASDVTAWQKQLWDKPMLRAMLQEMLSERCKLVAHRVPTEMQGYALVLKRGVKLQEMKAGEVLPPGMQLSEGVAVGYSKGEKPQMKLYGVSMSSLAGYLSMFGEGGQVRDETGLSGRYDLVLPKRDDLVEGNPAPASIWDVDAVGLELKPIKIKSESLVIDHMTRPSEN